MRFHPEIVARAVLSSVEPLNNGFDMPSHIFAALERIASDADRDTGLAPWLPKGGMMEAVRALQRRIAAGPIRVSVRDDAGKTQTVVLGAEDLQLALLAHTDEAEHWPAFILPLYYGHCDAWARQTIEDRSAGPIKLIGPLAASSLGVSADREHQMRTDPAVDLLGSWNFESNLVSAPDWPPPDMGDAVRLPRDLDSYRLRPWRLGTPRLRWRIRSACYLISPTAMPSSCTGAGHDGTFYQLRESPAAKQAIYDFLRTDETRGLPTDATLAAPKFEMPAFAPPKP
jgi:hypothetical protein